MVNVNALKEQIEKSGMTMVFIAERAGILRETLYNRLNEQGEFKASEITALTKVLKLSRNERDRIFFIE
jgi:hypothetical protein